MKTFKPRLMTPVQPQQVVCKQMRAIRERAFNHSETACHIKVLGVIKFQTTSAQRKAETTWPPLQGTRKWISCDQHYNWL
jgi:hypothetical protein